MSPNLSVDFEKRDFSDFNKTRPHLMGGSGPLTDKYADELLKHSGKVDNTNRNVLKRINILVYGQYFMCRPHYNNKLIRM